VDRLEIALLREDVHHLTVDAAAGTKGFEGRDHGLLEQVRIQTSLPGQPGKERVGVEQDQFIHPAAMATVERPQRLDDSRPVGVSRHHHDALAGHEAVADETRDSRGTRVRIIEKLNAMFG
jgi:hypothetical protein